LGLAQLGVVIIALGNERVDFAAHLKNIQRAGTQRCEYGHNQTYAHQHGVAKLYVHAPRVNARLQLVERGLASR
jgi:hypothetical protein